MLLLVAGHSVSPEIAKRCDPERNVLFGHVYGGKVKVYRAECNEQRAMDGGGGGSKAH